MVRSVEEILKTEFGKSLSDEGVHILDPFTGTGNFITRIMQSDQAVPPCPTSTPTNSTATKSCSSPTTSPA